MTSGDLQERLTKWFDKTGFPLEIETARAFFRHSFGVEHSAVYPDPESQKSREIDVLAYGGDETGVFSALFPIECKASDKPWVVLTSPERYSQYGGLWIAAMSPSARKAIADRIEQYVAIYGSVFGPSTGGFSLKQAFSGETDHAYTACMSALKAANSLVSDSEGQRLAFAFPTVVVSTPIFEYSEGTSGQAIFTEVTASSFSFSAHLNGYSRVIIRIVSSQALDAHAQRCRSMVDRYKELFSGRTKSLFRDGT